MPKVIDFHSHCVPPEHWNDALWGGNTPMKIERLIEEHAKVGIDFCVVTNTMHYIKPLDSVKALDELKRWNAYAAEVQRDHPESVVAFASSVPGGGDAYLEEFRRAIVDYGLRGCLINSSHQGHYPDEDEARPFFELAVELDAPVLVHAPFSSFGEECMQMYRLISSVGRPADETLSLARMIVRGVFEQLPDLKLIAAHCGGGICEAIPRMDTAYVMGDRGHFLGSYEPLLITKKPSEYLKQLYFDTASYATPVLQMGIDMIGIDHMVFGSDAPPLVPMLPEALEVVRRLNIPESDKQKIFSGNGVRLLGLEAAVA